MTGAVFHTTCGPTPATDPAGQRMTDRYGRTLVATVVARRPETNDPPAGRTPVTADRKRLRKPDKYHPDKSVPPNSRMCASLAMTRPRPRITHWTTKDTLEIQIESGYHLHVVLEALWAPPSKGAVGAATPTAPDFSNKNGPLPKEPFNPKFSTDLSIHSEIITTVRCTLLWNPTLFWGFVLAE